MPDTPPEQPVAPPPDTHADPAPDPRTELLVVPPLPWWLPGLVLGLVAALVVGLGRAAEVGSGPTPPGSHRATATVLLRPARGEAAAPEAERQRAAFLFRDRDLLTRAAAAPEVAEALARAKFEDPVPELERRLAVEAEGGALTVALYGDRPDDLAAIVDQIVMRFAEELAARDRKARDEDVAQCERVAAALRVEIESQEQALAMMARANGTDAAALRDRLARTEAELAKGAPELALLERRAEALKRRQAAGGAPDPVEAARLTDADPRVAPLVVQRADAAVALEKERAADPNGATVKDLQTKLDRTEAALAAARASVRKDVEALLRAADARTATRELEELEVRLAVVRGGQESLQRERDGLLKVLASAHATGANADAVRRTLVPLQEQADKVGARLAQLRTEGPAAEPRVQVAGPARAEPVRRPWRWGDAVGAAARALALGFALATAFQLTGLVFRALGHRG